MIRRGAVALLLLAAMVACHARKEQTAAPTPEVLYARGREAIERFDYAAAEQIADQGAARFAAQAHWRELFAILKAESLVKNEPARALRLLDETPATDAQLPAARRLMVRAATESTAKANETYLEADAIAARSLPELRPEIAARRTSLLFALGKSDEAKHAAQQAIDGATAAKQMFVLAIAHGGLGGDAGNHGQWAAGITQFSLALKYANAAHAAPLEVAAMANLGWCYLESGDLDQAMANLKPALDAAHQQSNDYYEHMTSVHIADIYIRRMEYAQALPYVKSALAAAQKLRKPKELANSYHQLGAIELRLGHLDAARTWNEKALATRGNEAKGVLTDLVDKGRILAATGNPAAGLQILDGVLASHDPVPDPATRWRVQGYEAEIYAKLGRLDAAKRMYDATLKTGTDERESVRGQDSLLAFERNFLSFYDGYIEMLRQSGRVAEALDVAERSRARFLREAVGLPSNAPVEPVRVARAKNATILFYWIGAKRSLLWTITPRGIDLAELPADDEIDRAADAYRTELQSPRHSLTGSTLGPKLYDMLVAPAKIAPPSRVIILPDAHLHALNFETLIAPEPQPHYWIDDVTVSYSPSLHLLAATPPWTAVRDARLLAFGNVPAAGREFPQLRQSGAEISAVARHFDPSRQVILSGAAATPASYTASHPETFDFIHFAAHATASTDTPLESSVILAPDGANGFRLSGRDIVRRPLAAQLVTISSCNSAGRRSYAGEGLVGLAWAFLGAGARRVVAAQWEVSDSTAPRVMDAMYASIGDGVEPAEALRRAKLALLHSDKIYRKPLYWAPFVVYGAL